MKELAGKLPERQALLAEFRRGTPEVRMFDESLSSVTWLAAVTRPVASGPTPVGWACHGRCSGSTRRKSSCAFEVAEADKGPGRSEFYEQYMLGSIGCESRFSP